MNVTPGWKAARDGLPGDLNATNHANQVDQFLGTHGMTPVYQGAQLVQPQGGANFSWLSYGVSTDLDQPFTLPAGHTSIGRVTIPVNPVGNGADLLVSLYPDNGSGAPDTTNLLSATTIPANWISQLAAPNGLASSGPLADAMFNTYYMSGGVTRVGWAPPTSGPYNTMNLATPTQSGNYLILAGGFSGFGPVYSAAVYTVPFVSSGRAALAVPQPSLPQATYQGGLAATSSALVYAGGYTSTGITSAVYTASWNPTTGAVGSWGAQTSLPSALADPAMVAHGSNVYFIGGYDNTNTASSVYWATVTNGQLTQWNSSQPLAAAVQNPLAGVVNGWLVVAGGQLSHSGSGSASTYYAKILSDGSLGPWRTGPSLPQTTFANFPNFSMVTIDGAIVIIGGDAGVGGFSTTEVQVLTVTANGPSNRWITHNWTDAVNFQNAAFSLGNGSWQAFTFDTFDQWYEYATLIPAPVMSVPLPASSLTAGATYHVVLQQRPSGTASDYLQYGINSASLPSDALKSSRHSGTWTTIQTGYSMPMAVYDNTANSPVLHTWSDPASTGSTYSSNLAAKTSTLVYNQYNLPFGLCEATALPNDPLNSNPTFTSGTSPWTATNCTLTQSSTQTHGGFAFSGLITPNGTSASVFIQSENVPINAGTAVTNPGRFYQVNGWVYSPTGWSSVSLSVNWYDRAGTLLSTSSNTVSLTVAAWTNLVNFFQAPLGAAQAAIVPAESGTPAAANTLYMSNVTLKAANELTTTVAPVSQVNYAPAGWPATNVTQLA